MGGSSTRASVEFVEPPAGDWFVTLPSGEQLLRGCLMAGLRMPSIFVFLGIITETGSFLSGHSSQATNQ